MTDVSDLLGFDPPKPARPSKFDQATALLEKMVETKKNGKQPVLRDEDNIEILHTAEAMHGVSVGWLATHFRMDPTTVKKRLRDCAPIATKKTGYIYDLKVAAQFLVKPVFNVEEYLKTMNPRDLPVVLQEAYWSGMRKRQQYEEAARDLWPTHRVLEVFGDTFQHIKFAMQLWPDNVERALGLSEEQRTMLIKMCDDLQTDIHARLVVMPREKKTPSSIEPDVPPQIEVIEDGTDLI